MDITNIQTNRFSFIINYRSMFICLTIFLGVIKKHIATKFVAKAQIQNRLLYDEDDGYAFKIYSV